MSEVPIDYLEWIVGPHDKPMQKWQTGPAWAELKRRQNPANGNGHAAPAARQPIKKHQGPVDPEYVNRLFLEASYEF